MVTAKGITVTSGKLRFFGVVQKLRHLGDGCMFVTSYRRRYSPLSLKQPFCLGLGEGRGVRSCGYELQP